MKLSTNKVCEKEKGFLQRIFSGVLEILPKKQGYSGAVIELDGYYTAQDLKIIYETMLEIDERIIHERNIRNNTTT
jgi:hypothetical protein